MIQGSSNVQKESISQCVETDEIRYHWRSIFIQLILYIVRSSEVLTWSEANDDCAQDGATLTSIHADSENAAIQLVGFETDTEEMWIGINDLNVRIISF